MLLEMAILDKNILLMAYLLNRLYQEDYIIYYIFFPSIAVYILHYLHYLHQMYLDLYYDFYYLY